MFDNKTLAAIARTAPTTLRDLGRISGVGPAKLERYGNAVIELIANVRRVNGTDGTLATHAVVRGPVRWSAVNGRVGESPARQRPLWRGKMHAWTFFVAIPAGIVLIAMADGTAATVAAAIYAATLLLLFGTSASYHRLAHSSGPAR